MNTRANADGAAPRGNDDRNPAAASTRRDLLRLAQGSAIASAVSAVSRVAFAASTDKTTEPIYMSATKLAESLRAKRISATEAVQAFIDRQLAVNDRLNAVVTNCYARALAEAKALDEKAARNEFVGPLHGVPMTIKDSIDTEGVISTGATMGRQQHVPQRDATVVARLRKAGAIVLGKTNTPEFTLGGLAGINSASNLLFGASHNPYDLTRSTSGSSGGAGAIVAAGGAAFDIGSDWGGSIRAPAHNNGIAGIKPTSVRVPRTGHIVDYGGVFDLWQQLGPMTRRVEDLALITPIISGPDFRDASCAPVPWRDPANVILKELRVAFCVDNGSTGPSATLPEIKETVRQAVKWLEPETRSVAEDSPTGVLDALNAARALLTRGDAWAFYKRLADKWGSNNFSPSVTARIQDMTPISSAEYIEAWEKHDAGKSRMLEWMSAYDVFLCPVAGKTALPIDLPAGAPTEWGGTGAGWQYTGIFNSTGWPAVVVRCGSSPDGKLPIGVQVIARPWREDVCLAVASYLEQRSGGWQRPPI
jgi:amidase